MFNFVIRADASVIIGSGHIMRCLTLADKLRWQGAKIVFVCRELPGNMCQYIEDKGYKVYKLPYSGVVSQNELDKRAVWSGETWQRDAAQTAEILKSGDFENVKWLIVDHYGLDIQWEVLMRPLVGKIMVIDDLADRKHDCDVLLDQNYYTNMLTRYNGLISKTCKTLLGPQFVLLRPEFLEARKAAKVREGIVKRILIFIGGSDPTNETTKALQAIKILNRNDIHTDVVVGKSNPHCEQIEKLCNKMCNVTFHCQINNMAELMVNADLAIGGGGGTTWERLCLGLPSLVLRIADNQERVTKDAENEGVLVDIGNAASINSDSLAFYLQQIILDQQRLKRMSHRAINFIDGSGVERVIGCLLKL